MWCNKITEDLTIQQNLRSYLFFWSGQLFSILGSSITQFVIVWWLTIITGSPIILSIASFLYVLPLTITFLIGGVISDKFDRKRIIIVVDPLQAFVTFLLIILFNLELINPLLVIIINGILGTFQGFHIPTVSAIVPTMVPKDKLSRMNGINFLFTSFIQMIGPIVAALLLSLIPIKTILWIDPITFLIAIIPLLLIKIPSIKTEIIQEKKTSFVEDLKIGFRTLKLIPIIFMMLLVAMFVNFLWRPFSILLSYFIYFDHPGTISDLAFILAFLNGGMFLGAIITSLKKRWKNGIFIYFIGELLLMVSYLIIAITPHGWFLLMGFAAGMFGLIVPIINTIYLTIMQLRVPPDKMGRISSIDYAISSAITPIGTILSGPLAEIFGVSNLFLYCSIIGIIITLILWGITHLVVNNNKENKSKTNINRDILE